ncbi:MULTISPECIES: FAD-binding oxidoreductase [Streptomyces]|uniref:FAD-binding oxidoreductase n=1 Tax=Streptomyces ehimensis TaxID=68195 RepID=A0ABV9BVX0_9ACTN
MNDNLHAKTPAVGTGGRLSNLDRRRFLLRGSGAALGAVAATQVGLPAARAAAAPGAGIAAAPAVTVTPNDTRYIDLTSGLNQRWTAEPERIVLPRTTEQVVAAVQDAVRRGKRISVRGGGHCFEDFVYHSDVQVLINMNLMDDVSFDEKRNAFAVEGGATLLRVYEELYESWGVTLPGGACFSVGVGGHVSGGGYGMLSRRHGLSVDHLEAVEVVVVDAQGNARSVVASRDPKDPNHELFWAHTGGGGGNFGVITKFWFRSPDATGTDPRKLLPAPPAEVFVTSAAWPWEKVTREGFVKLVDFYGKWLEANSSPQSPYADLCSWLFLNHKSLGSLGMMVQMDATVPNAAKLLTDFLSGLDRALGVSDTPGVPQRGGDRAVSQFFTTHRLPWLRATKYVGTAAPQQTDPTMRGKHKSAFHRKGLPTAAIETLYTQLTSTTHKARFAGLVLPSTGGRISSRSATDTAVAQRDSIMKITYETYWQDRGDDDANIAWVRDVYQAVYADTGGVPVPNAVTDGCYINYPDADISDPQFNKSSVPWTELYYKGNYQRLQQVKRTWDPKDIFRHRQSVRP